MRSITGLMAVILSSKKGYLIIRIFLGGVFMVSGGMKLFDIKSFTQIIEAFAVLPGGLVTPAAVLIPWAELVLGMALFVDIKGSLTGVFCLLIGFAGVLAWALFMGYDIDCGCFGPQDPEAKAFGSLRTSLARDIIMIGMVLYLYAWRRVNHHNSGYLKMR